MEMTALGRPHERKNDKMKGPPIILWFRRDLRLQDNPALQYVASLGRPVIPLFVWAPSENERWPLNERQKWWLRRSLVSLSDSLSDLGSALIIRNGPSLEALLDIARETRAKTVVWNRCYEPFQTKLDVRIESSLGKEDIETYSFNGMLLYEPGSIRTRVGASFRRFTPYWRACLASPAPREPVPVPANLIPMEDDLGTQHLARVDTWREAEKFSASTEGWVPGEKGAAAALSLFLERRCSSYAADRDTVARDGTSRLSPHLHFGEISVNKIRTKLSLGRVSGHQEAQRAYLRQLGWREFAYDVLFNNPDCLENPLRQLYVKFEWRHDPDSLYAWERGETGYPLVDAGMRQLAAVGWMPNRVRMSAASFLVKHLLVSWQAGAQWFWKRLMDADLANNVMGWQWVAGCGFDAAPYFRIFNPVLQGERFDPRGTYVKRWVPELANLDGQFVHKPWTASETTLRRAGLALGHDYPWPIIGHEFARKRALGAWSRMRKHQGAEK